MFDKTMNGESRLAAWRNFRTNYDISQGPEGILEAFADVKVTPRYIDYWTPKDWPNVFEIVKEGYICQSGLTLIITATLHHFNFINTPEIRLEAISNFETGTDGLILIQENLCYNFTPGQIIPLAHAHENCTRFVSHIITADKLFA